MMDMYLKEKLEINILVTIQNSGIIEGFEKWISYQYHSIKCALIE